ncbi:hypothetical protein AB0A98_22425 [Streptomyces chrestomyceticus]|uniref:hypothetical protein n=1 Tax=Streptomyces chrestomyceticus TaxID=68185 RepID=UPI0033E41018
MKLDRPEFQGSTRSVLANRDVHGCVGQAVQNHLGRWLQDDAERAAAVIGRIVQGVRKVISRLDAFWTLPSLPSATG